MNYNKNYDILTLRDCIGCNEKENLGDIFGTAISFIGGLFGDDRRELTMTDWNQLFPGNGYWSNRLKQYLASKIRYDVDLKYIYDHGKGTGDFDNFAGENACQLFPNYDNCTPPEGRRAGLQKILQQELINPSYSTTSPTGISPTSPNLIPGVTQFQTPPILQGSLPLIVGAVLVGMLISKQGKRR